MKNAVVNILLGAIFLFALPAYCQSGNTFLGDNAGNSNTTGSSNSFYGSLTGESNMTGGSNSFYGESAGRDNTTGNSNSCFGRFCGEHNVSGGSNSFYGNSAGRFNTTGNSNSYFGQNAGRNNITGFSNSFFGFSAGNQNTGRQNTFFGWHAGSEIINGSRNIIIGHGAGPSSANSSVSNRLFIDVNGNNTGNDEPLIYGEFDNDFVRINGTFEVTAGLNNPSSIKLKDRFMSVAPALILEKINALDITEWSYKTNPDVRHIGPTAESFYEAFGLGTGGDNISTIDADGVSLVAIQALTNQLEEQQKQMDDKDHEILELQEEINEIRQQLNDIKSFLSNKE